MGGLGVGPLTGVLEWGMDKKKALEVVVMLLQRVPLNIAEVEAVNVALGVLREAEAPSRLDRADDGNVVEFPRP